MSEEREFQVHPGAGNEHMIEKRKGANPATVAREYMNDLIEEGRAAGTETIVVFDLISEEEFRFEYVSPSVVRAADCSHPLEKALVPAFINLEDRFIYLSRKVEHLTERYEQHRAATAKVRREMRENRRATDASFVILNQLLLNRVEELEKFLAEFRDERPLPPLPKRGFFSGLFR